MPSCLELPYLLSQRMKINFHICKLEPILQWHHSSCDIAIHNWNGHFLLSAPLLGPQSSQISAVFVFTTIHLYIFVGEIFWLPHAWPQCYQLSDRQNIPATTGVKFCHDDTHIQSHKVKAILAIAFLQRVIIEFIHVVLEARTIILLSQQLFNDIQWHLEGISIHFSQTITFHFLNCFFCHALFLFEYWQCRGTGNTWRWRIVWQATLKP